ncbi:RICIN domain-containing protein [Actinosynnema sp. CA-248983]
MESHHLRPPEAEDAAEFVAAMRALRVRSGYSFRVLERRAANVGEVLPTSTLNSALSRSTLPREQIVVAFVRACGGDEETAAAWARVRADLAAADLEAAEQEPEAVEPEPLEASEPEKPAVIEPEPPAAPVAPVVETVPAVVRRSRAVAVVSGVAAVALAVVLVAVLSDSPPAAEPNAAPTSTITTASSAAETTTPTTTSTAPTENPAPASQNPQPVPVTTVPTTENRPQPPPNGGGPRDGIQRLRLAHTGLCVGEGPERGNTQPRIVLGQYDCATATPPTELERLADGSFRIKLHNVDNGVGCATVDYRGTDVGVLIAGDDCADRADQRFTLEPVAAGYRLRSVPGARYCIGVYGGSRSAGAQLIQDPCDGGAHQVFQLG